MKKYLIIFFVIFLSGGAITCFAKEGISLDPNNAWNNIQGFFLDIWQKITEIWQNNAWPWINNLWLKFRAFFDEKKIKEEFEKERKEMGASLGEAGKHIFNMIKR